VVVINQNVGGGNTIPVMLCGLLADITIKRGFTAREFCSLVFLGIKYLNTQHSPILLVDSGERFG